LQTYYIAAKDTARTNAQGKDLSTTARLHIKMPMKSGFKIQKIFVSDTASNDSAQRCRYVV